jgi:hypothetical protein
LRDLSTIQFRLAFKDKGHNFHKSLEYCCLVIHLTSVSKNFLRWIERWCFYPYCAIRHYKYKDKRTASDLSVCQQIYILRAILSTIQFRLIFKGHQSQKYCCLVIHLTSVNTISYAESNDFIFILKLLALRHYSLGITISYFTLQYRLQFSR